MSGRVLSLASVIVAALLVLWFLCALPELADSLSQSNGVIISEVAWSGTAAGEYYEWLELYNTGQEPVNVTGWTLRDNDLLTTLSGIIGPDEYFVLERNEYALIDVAADQFLIGSLDDEGETIQLLDQDANLVDSANSAGGPWPAGTAAEQYRSMERVNPLAIDDPTNWISNDGLTRNGLDTDARPVNGTPGMPNSIWPATQHADLVLRKSGPDIVPAGSAIQYRLAISNTGMAAATGVILTDTLPQAASFVGHDGQFPLTMPLSDTLAWQIGTLDSGASISINLTTTVGIDYAGLITNNARVNVAPSELNSADNHASLATLVSAPESVILIDAVYYDGYEFQDSDEAVRLINVGSSPQALIDWRLSDGLHDAVFPPGAVIEPGEGIWIADWAASFRRQFGHDPDFEVRGSDPGIPNLVGTWPGYSNAGDEVLLIDASGNLEDVLVYAGGDVSQPGWSGQALKPYAVTGVFAAEGQVLFRRPGPGGLSRAPDTDSAVDWAQSNHDPVLGRRVRYPGWDIERFYRTEWFTETAELVIGIAPDNALELLRDELAGAESELKLVSHTFRSDALKQELLAALGRGLSVTVLLEGAPVGGIDDAQRAICQELENAGGQCWFMINDPDKDIHDRYRYLHAKYILVDDRRVIVSTENLSPDSYPETHEDDGLLGRRGVTVVTNAPAVVNHFRSLWAVDFDPENHRDIARWSAIEATPEPAQRYQSQLGSTEWLTYSVVFTEPLRLSGSFPFAVVQAPENPLGSAAGLLHLLAQAGPGDTILVEQLSERPHWGASSSDPLQDPNPRLEALVDAARRGASVRLLLDEFFDDQNSPVGNLATCRYVGQIADVERLKLGCERSNPSGLGLHNKMILAEINGQGYVFVGSINGTELSNKGNRETALLFQSNEAYSLLASMFIRDRPHRISFPLFLFDYIGPAQHILISEVLYDPSGSDHSEFIELFNPTYRPLDLSGFSISDAVNRSDFEDLRHFPSGTVIDAGEALVVSVSSTGFYAEFGFRPDFEILDSDPYVPDLVDNLEWGDPATFLKLANQGDEVIVRDPLGRIVEAIAYGSGRLPGALSCPLNTIAEASLERYPPWRDTDDCPADFREWPFPNPGTVP